MRSERMVHVGHAARRRIICHPLGGADASDAATVDLDELDLAIVDQMARHMKIVRAFSPGEPYVRAACRQCCVGLQSAGLKWFFQPMSVDCFQSRQASGGSFDSVAPCLPRIDAHQSILAHALACRMQLVGICSDRAPERTPAEFDGAKSLAARGFALV